MKKYFHELSDKERESLPGSGAKWDDFKAPDWCLLGQDAVQSLGCWGLTCGAVHRNGISYCEKCDEFNPTHPKE